MSHAISYIIGLTVPQNGRSPPSAKEERVPPSAVSDSQDIMVQPKCEPCPVRYVNTGKF